MSRIRGLLYGPGGNGRGPETNHFVSGRHCLPSLRRRWSSRRPYRRLQVPRPRPSYGRRCSPPPWRPFCSQSLQPSPWMRVASFVPLESGASNLPRSASAFWSVSSSQRGFPYDPSAGLGDCACARSVAPHHGKRGRCTPPPSRSTEPGEGAVLELTPHRRSRARPRMAERRSRCRFWTPATCCRRELREADRAREIGSSTTSTGLRPELVDGTYTATSDAGRRHRWSRGSFTVDTTVPTPTFLDEAERSH